MGLQGWHCQSQPCPWCQRPRGHTLLVCTLLLLLAVFRLTLNSMKLVLPLNCISYLIVRLPGFAPSSRPQIKNLHLEQ